MLKNIIKITILIMFLPSLAGAQGLLFNANDNLIADRTSYNVFAHYQPKFEGDFSMSFEVSIIDTQSFGHIMNLKDKKSSISYSLVYVSLDENFGEIKLNLDGVKNLCSVLIKKELLGSRKWVSLSLSFNTINNRIDLVANNQLFSVNQHNFGDIVIPEIYFGKHENVIDVPSMALRNLSITNGSRNYVFKFNESSGMEVYDSKGEKYGFVNNPNWLISESYNWKKIYKASFSQVSSLTFDETNQRFIIQNADTLLFYDLKDGSTTSNTYKNKLPISMRLGTSFLDISKNKLYVYEVNDIPIEKASVASLNLKEELIWKTISFNQLPQQRHHHNSFFDSDKNQFIIFGGFGNQKLTNEFNLFDVSSGKWDSLSFTGDTISPRYFSGLSKIGDSEALLFGGIGNETGDQSLGTQHLFDCYKINFDTKVIKKLWTRNNEDLKLVSTRNMVLSNDSKSFYTLAYPEYISESCLRLYKYSVKDGSQEVFGDSIPLISERIRTNANLYLNRETDQFLCAIQEFELDGSNRIKIYSINNPPVSTDEINFNYSKKGDDMPFG
ncbi:MAG: hypothetical protein IZT56_14315, partial [Bacteroidetes bacterium]|nr:hypothetical protein [Bacteroidota bacterium]